ncbi:RagB/SusD family nutrient uptake outer membrane protein [Flavihumibacter sp. CACIAM 22H1]|uniref:RagB/SusD family nutrient uptake outer membrane protein n=1 Tax=Flavihumibacter sp. CACIAM 22H1 TaxID=1812911 RepID=UPI0007A816B8|nr:RagB/SusD family nutrient uptake outer membrane protein [Flavihumibacter sp. CACIAM 22H1]KYP13833.1 MAG: glycan metabolism protein RagB [Flavihumibacter sp. CACIAM 22H1]
MRTKSILTALVIGSVVFTGCKKEFLDTDATEFVTDRGLSEAVALDPNLLNGNIAGLYTSMYTAEIGGTTQDDDFGQKSVDIYMDMLSSDMVLGALNYGWYSNVARFQSSLDFTRIDNYHPWRYYYRIIFGANLIIDALGGTDATPTEVSERHLMGQAKAMRAYAYFYLSHVYSKEYGAGTEKTIPLYTSATQLNQPRVTAQEIYNLIVDDLNKAIEYLDDFERATKDQVNKDVAKGLLAYALAARGAAGDWAQVETLTQDVIDAGYPVTSRGATVAVLSGNTVTNPESGFNNVATPSWIWGVDINLQSGLDLVSWWGQMDIYTYSYAWAGDPKIIDIGLYNSMRPDDIRRNQFDADLAPSNKFFDPKRQIGGQRIIETDYIYMRVDEMYMLNAEAKANLNKDAEAIAVLKEILENRLDDVSYLDALSGQALKDEIYKQTRLEFWGEGKSYLAMKRNKATTTRGANHLFFPGESFPYNADELTFPIPQQEVINNPNLNN